MTRIATDHRPSDGPDRPLTGAGMATLEAAAPGHVAGVRRLIFDRLTPADVTRLQAITDKLLPSLTTAS